VAAPTPSAQPAYRGKPMSSAMKNASPGVTLAKNSASLTFATTDQMNAHIKTITSPATTTARQPTARVAPKAITKATASAATTTSIRARLVGMAASGLAHPRFYLGGWRKTPRGAGERLARRLGDSKVVTAEHYRYALGDYAEVDYQAALERSA
jgi:hypothetical protein